MTTPKRSSEPEPFHEPLTPLPADVVQSTTSKPEAGGAQDPEMDSETVLPAEGGIELDLEMAVPAPKDRPRWQFWKRPSKRDEQLETLRKGASEMVGLMRSIRDHLEGERDERDGLRQTLSPLPVAVESLKSMSEHQADTGRVLGELQTSIERRTENDSVLLRSLNRIGTTMSKVEGTFSQMDRTLSGLDRSNQATVSTMQELGGRVTDSDRFMNETFARLRDSEHEFTEHISRASHRSNAAMLAVCSILLLSVVAVGFMFRENRELLAAVQKSGALVVHVPRGEREVPEGVAILEDLNQVDDGIGEPDREIVKRPRVRPGAQVPLGPPPELARPVPVAAAGDAEAENAVQGRSASAPEVWPEVSGPKATDLPEEDKDSLLSINKLPRRE